MQVLKIIHVLLFSSTLLSGLTLFLMSKKESVSVQEKRNLAKIKKVNLDNFLDGSIMVHYQKYVDDHFPFRNELIDLAFILNKNKGVVNKKQVRLIQKNQEKKIDEKKIDLNKAARDVNYIVNAESSSSHGLLIIEGRAFQVFGGSKSSVKSYVDVVNEYRKLLPSNVRIFNCIVPTGSSFIFNEEYNYLRNREFQNIDDAYSMNENGVINVRAKEALVNHENEYIYFASDHHWTGLGAYYAYSAYCEAAGLNAMPLSKMTKKIKSNFLGSLYNLTKDNSLRTDSVEYFVSPINTEGRVLNENAKGTNSYCVFLGGDFPYVKIKTSIKNGQSVVLIKNSFGNPFATFLVNNYETVHVVDYRYYNKGLLNLIKDESINDVIFFHNVFSANTLSHSQRQRIIKGPLGASQKN
ncbi:MAG: hypothetical protein RLZ10_1871 [Bacteroidota bacterium]|jgi:hypothetical protein